MSGSHVGIFLVSALFELALLAVFFWAWASILRKAGYSGWMVLLALIPLVNMVMFFVFAFQKWPAQVELEQLRARVGGQPGYPGTPGGGYPAQGGAYPPSAPGGYPAQGGGYPGGYPGR